VATNKDRPELEAALTSGEVVADALMRGDVLADVPIIGTAFKLLKAADNIRDRAFATKLSRFLLALADISEDARKRLKEKVRNSAEEAKKVGETLLLILDRITDLDKPTLLSHLFLAYVDGVVTGDDLRRLTQAVDAAFADDLQKLLELHRLPEKSQEPWMQYLAASGLTRIVGGETYEEIGKVFYEVAPLGNRLRTAYFHGRKLTANPSLQRAPKNSGRR